MAIKITQRGCFCRKKNPRPQIDFIDKNIAQNLLLRFFGNTNKSNKNTNFVTKVALNTYKTGG